MTTPFPPGSLVAAYLRDSGGDTQELSVQQQETAFRQWCADHDLAPGSIFSDAARPGSSVVGRQAFHDMMHHFRAGAPEAGLAIWSFSRFSRDFDDAQFYRADLRRRGYLLYSLNDAIPDGSMGRLFEAIIDWKNEQFLEDLSRDVRRGLHDLVLTHGAIPGTPPRGFIRQPVEIGDRRNGRPHVAHRWAPDPEMIPLVRQAFAMRAAGDPLSKILSTTRLYSSINSFKTFFENKLYIGILEFGDLAIDDYCEPVIDLETWNAVQAVLKKHAAHGNNTQPGSQAHPRRVGSRYLLSGLAFCARCGSPLYGSTSPQRNRTIVDRYACTRAARRRDCDLLSIPRQTLEKTVLETVRGYILLPEVQLAHQDWILADQTTYQARIHKQRLEAIAQLAGVRKRATHIATAIAESGHSRTLLEKLAALEAEENSLRANIAGLDRQASARLHELPPEALNAALAEIQAALDADPQTVLRGFVQRIIVDREGQSIRGGIDYYFPPTIPPIRRPL